MVEFETNITTEYWDEDLFDCEATKEGARRMTEIAQRFQGLSQPHFDEEYLTINEAKEEYGLEVISSGQARVVIELPEEWGTGHTDCIAKIQWDPHYQQTHAEIEMWQNVNGRQAALLAPLLDWSVTYEWLIMPRATMYDDLTAKEAGNIVRTLRRKLRDVGLSGTDIRRANVGRIEGRDVVIDYGNLKRK